MQADGLLTAAKSALQQELVALKSQHGDRFHLHKAHSGPHAPFPVIASLHVDKPPAAEAYDIFEALQIRITIHVAALSPDRTEAASGLGVEVRTSELPQRLREHIAASLLSSWRRRYLALDGGSVLGLGLLTQVAQDKYLELLTSLPGCTEAYESISPSGATLRRFAVIQDSVADAEALSCQTSSARNTAGQARTLSGPAVVDPPAVHGLDRDMLWARRKFGAPACELLPRAETGKDGETLMCLRLMMQPTDPAWRPLDGKLQLEFTVGCSYPAAGSLAVAVQPGGSCGISELGLKLLGRLWDAEAGSMTSPSGAPPRAASPLKQLILSIENRAGEAARQVEQALARQVAGPQLPPELISAAGVTTCAPPDSSSGDGEGSGPLWRCRVGAGLWWPCLPGGDAASVRAIALPPVLEHTAVSAGDTSEAQGIPDALSRSPVEGASDGGSPSSASEGGRSGPEGEGARSCRPGRGRLPAPSVRPAVELQLTGLRCGGIDGMEVHTLTLQMSCRRCGRVAAVTLAPGEASTRQPETRAEGGCTTCHSDWAVVLQPRHVHEAGSGLGLLWPSGCALLDLLPSTLQVQCASCSASGALRQVKSGSTAERACSHCHTALSVHFSGVNFVPRSTAPARGRRLPRRRHQGADGDSDGGPEATALVDSGACKHYKHSYRWLRYPCCGACFPCDACHEAAADGHHMEWAQQMVCGFCSREQPLDSHCSFCHRRLSSGSGVLLDARSQVREGGLGVRDKIHLDSRDSHKHTIGKLKTHSKRSERVGQRGKQLREQRQAARAD